MTTNRVQHSNGRKYQRRPAIIGHVPAIRTNGRPSEYRPEYDDIVVRLGEQGNSPAQIATVLRINIGTMRRWGVDRDSFRAALARAKTAEQAYWETIGHQALNRKHFQAQVYRQAMAGRFREDYTDGKQSVEVNLDLADLVMQSLSSSNPVQKVEAVVQKLESPSKKE
jgi:hypothetical protein